MSENPCLIVNGYHSATTMKTILRELTMFIVNKVVYNTKAKLMTYQDQFEYVKRTLNNIDDSHGFKHLYLVIHSMDMGALKSAEWQAQLAELATCKALKLIVSLDHIKAGVMFTDHQMDNFNFVCQ